jgi:hypothetical protein
MRSSLSMPGRVFEKLNWWVCRSQPRTIMRSLYLRKENKWHHPSYLQRVVPLWFENHYTDKQLRFEGLRILQCIRVTPNPRYSDARDLFPNMECKTDKLIFADLENIWQALSLPFIWTLLWSKSSAHTAVAILGRNFLRYSIQLIISVTTIQQDLVLRAGLLGMRCMTVHITYSWWLEWPVEVVSFLVRSSALKDIS